MSTTELKPCPFCGGIKFTIEMREHRHLNSVSDWYYLRCDEGGCAGKTDYPSREGLIERWNTRPSEPVAVKVKALKWIGPDAFGEYFDSSCRYIIRPSNGNGHWLTDVGKYFPTVEAAQAAAMADHTEKSLADIELAPVKAQDDLVDALREIASKYHEYLHYEDLVTLSDAACALFRAADTRSALVAGDGGEPVVDLLARSVAAFQAMTPEQQEAMCKQQRDGWVRAEMDMDRLGTTTVLKPDLRAGISEVVATMSLDLDAAREAANARSERMRVETEPSAIRNAALEESFREGLEAACGVIDAHSEYDRQLCCDGRECGCYGSTVHQSMQHYIRALQTAPASLNAEAGRLPLAERDCEAVKP